MLLSSIQRGVRLADSARASTSYISDCQCGQFVGRSNFSSSRSNKKLAHEHQAAAHVVQSRQEAVRGALTAKIAKHGDDAGIDGC